VIGPKGLLRNKTRVLVTHGVSFLQQMDQIVVMKAGTITEVGSYRQLLDQKGEFADFLIQYLAEKQDEDNMSSATSQHDPEIESELEELKSDLEQSLGKRRLERQLSKVRSERSSAISELTAIDRRATSAGKKPAQSDAPQVGTIKGEIIIETERAEVGGVKWSVYSYYAKSVGLVATAVSLAFYVIYQGFSVGSNIWLSAWSDDPRASDEPGVRNMYLGVYGALGVMQSISIMVATTVISIFTLNAAIKLHQSMLMRILKSPMSFFDTTPLGRILNRFSKDIDVVDNSIPMTMRMVLNQLLNVLGTLVAIIFAMPIFIVVVIPVAVLYYFLQKFFVTTARQLKRMEAISRSPIFTHFGETITGSSTIRAFDRAESFVRENERRVDENQICYYPIVVANRWLAVRLELVGNMIILFASLFAVISRGTIQPGLVGLSLSYALNVTNALNMLVRMTTEVETNMVSVERIQEYQGGSF
jgi:ATP-binding cassette, subfamily C (CFTR/MRP), member 1